MDTSHVVFAIVIIIAVTVLILYNRNPKYSRILIRERSSSLAWVAMTQLSATLNSSGPYPSDTYISSVLSNAKIAVSNGNLPSESEIQDTINAGLGYLNNISGTDPNSCPIIQTWNQVILSIIPPNTEWVDWNCWG
jgi:type II secretory pathway pseudopilin PulG